MLRIPGKFRDEMIAHAREEFPGEACGILGGSEGIATTIYRISNIDHDPRHFLMDPREQAAALSELEVAGLEIVAFYHSHPSGPEYPSSEDIRLAFYPDIPSLIVSLADPASPVLNAFSIRNGIVESLVLEFIHD